VPIIAEAGKLSRAFPGIPSRSWERAKVYIVMLKALSGELHWFQAADILGWSPRARMQRLVGGLGLYLWGCTLTAGCGVTARCDFSRMQG